MSIKFKKFFGALSLLAILVSFIPMNQPAQAATTLPPVDMFQLPWDEGIAWVAIDGFDDGSDRLPGSPHNFHNGGAVDFAPRPVMFRGEDTSNFWVTAAAAGTIVEISKCHMKIDHGNGWVTEYQHLANIQVHLGDSVARNQRLAIIANASARQPVCAGSEPPDIPHLHFTLRPSMVGATFAGWQFKYNAFFNSTSFAKDGKIVTLFKPLLNVMSQPTPTATPTGQASATPTIPPTATPDLSQATATPSSQPTNTPEVFATATPTAQATDTPGPFETATPTGQATNTPEPSATATPTPLGPFVSTTINPTSITIGETALASVNLNDVPGEGYTSTEFTCTFDPALVETSNIVVTNLFGADAVAAINVPQNGTFIIAIAGSRGNKATASGAAFTFDVKALQAGQTTIDCQARVSKGDGVLTSLPSFGSALTILEFTPTPTFTPTPVFTSTPEFTPTPTSVTNDWLTFTNSTFGFQFQYPPQGQIQVGSTDTFTRINNLPIVQSGTNLFEKYLEVVVGQNVTECKSPLQTQDPGVTVTINGINFLKQTGEEGAAGSIYQWVAYSTLRDGVCVSLDFILHAHNPGVFPTPPPLYDPTVESAIFDQIVGTYMWLAQAPTATPTIIVSTPVESPTPEFTPTPAESPTPTFTSTPIASPTPVESPTPTFTPTPIASPTPTPLPVGMLTGQVLASKPVTINLYNADDTLAASVSANADGTFAITVLPGMYKVVATASGFLSAQGSVTITSGNTTTLPIISLRAGDIDNNNVIDQFDALTIGMNYNSATPAAADLNNDGIINVLDLELLARNYRDTGPTVWQ